MNTLLFSGMGETTTRTGEVPSRCGGETVGSRSGETPPTFSGETDYAGENPSSGEYPA